MKNKKTQIKRILLVGGAILLLASLLTGVLIITGVFTAKPELFFRTPRDVSFGSRTPFTVDLLITDLGESDYPAASFSIAFDRSRLEFLGVSEGTVLISDGTGGATPPEWSVNIQKSNETGVINVMYLDLSGGKRAFSKDLLTGEEQIVLRLTFCLRGSARRGDAYEFSVTDAVFASNQEENSLSLRAGTLPAKSGTLIVK